MPSDEDKENVEQALRAADSGKAGHWPTVAGILADEVRRLRTELARPVCDHVWHTVEAGVRYGHISGDRGPGVKERCASGRVNSDF